MKKIVLCFLFVATTGFAKNLIPQLASDKIPNWRPPHVLKETLPNGFRLYMLPDKSLPLFKAKLFIEAGGIDEPLKQTGLADLTADLLVLGGTKEKTPLEVDHWLDQRAISLSASAGKELTTVTLSSLSFQQKEGLRFLKEILLEPRFDAGRLQIEKNHMKEGLRRDKDQPEAILSKNFWELIFDKGHPWRRSAEWKTIKGIGQKDVANFYRKNFYPNRMLLTVAGDFSPAELKRWAEETFGGLSKVEVARPSLPVIPLTTRFEEKKIRKKLTQAFIEVGHLGLARNQKEKYAYGLLQYILGGDVFTSRLGKDIRTTLGLAYSVYSSWETNPVRGMFKIHVETKTETKEKVLERIRYHLKRVSVEGDISEEELDRAKEAMLNQYIFWFDSPFNVVEMKAKFDLLGYEEDYLEKYPQRIRTVTLEELKKVARETIQPEGLKIVIVGP